MATYEDYMKAARKAHEAGDADAARRLVGMAKGAKQGGGNVIATTPDGGQFIRMGDGKTVFKNAGYATSDPETVKRLMAGDSVKKVVQSETDRQVIAQHPITARVQEFNRGAPFIGSYLDEAVGVFSPKARDAMRATSDAMQREKPGQSMGLNVGGAIGYGVPMAIGAAATAPAWLGSKVGGLLGTTRAGQALTSGLLGAGAGGTEGLIYGFGEGEGDDRVSSALEQGAIGGAFGGAFGVVAPSVGELFTSLARRYKADDVGKIAKEFKVSRESAEVLKKAFEQNDQTAFDRVMRAGSEATLADAGRSGSALLDAAAQTGGRPLNIVDQAVTARNDRSAGLLKGALDDTLSPPKVADTALQVVDGAMQADVERRARLLPFDGPVGPREMAADIARRSAPARKALYGAAYDTPIDYAAPEGRAVEALLAKINPQRLDDAVKLANDRLMWEGGQKQIMASIGDDGAVVFREMPDVRQLDELKRALDQIGQNALDQFGRPTDGGMAASQARALRRAIIDATGGNDGPYAKALSVGADKIEMDRALELGLEMMRDGKNTTPEVVREQLSEMGGDARRMVRAGLRSYIDDLTGRVRAVASDPDGQDARQALAALKNMSSDNARSKLKLLLGPEDYAKLQPKLDEAMASQAMKADVSRNSATAIRGSIQGTVDDVTQPGLLGKVARGEPVDATKRLTQELLNTTPGADAARKEQIWSEIAEVLSQRRGNKSAEAAMRYIEKAIAGQPLREAEAKLIASQTVLALPVLSGRAGNLSLQQP